MEAWMHEPAVKNEAAEPGLEFLQTHFHSEAKPWPQVWGYVVSLVLTFGALLLVENHVLAPIWLLTTILVLAFGQALLQLGVFMHLKEGRGTAWQIIPLGLALIIAVGLVGMSMWIMMFKSGVS